AAASLFATHPAHTEAVSWIAGVGDLSCAVFYFAGLVAFVRYANRRQNRYLWAASFCFLGALFSKEVAITFPLVVILLAFWIQGTLPGLRRFLLMMLPFALAAVFYAAMRISVVGLKLPNVIDTRATMLDWATLMLWVVGNYIRYFVVPYPLSAQHLVP